MRNSTFHIQYSILAYIGGLYIRGRGVYIGGIIYIQF